MRPAPLPRPYTLGLVKSHFPEADLDPVGDWMAPETSDLAWADYLADAQPITERKLRLER